MNTTSPTVNTTSTQDSKVTTPRGKGKQRKRFLEKNDAISLAASIADTQEKITNTKAERHHKPRDDTLPKQERRHSSSSKIKLKETKAALKAKQIDAKRERAKSRRERLKPKPAGKIPDKCASGQQEKKIRKTVSFA